MVPRPAVSAGLWETQTSGPTSDLQYQNLHCNTVPSGFLRTLKFEKHWSVPSVVLRGLTVVSSGLSLMSQSAAQELKVLSSLNSMTIFKDGPSYPVLEMLWVWGEHHPEAAQCPR